MPFSGHPKSEWRGTDTGHITALAFSEDDSLLASSGFDAKVRLWRPGSWMELTALEGHENCANDLRYVKGKRILVSGSSDGTVRHWSLTQQAEEKMTQAHKKPVSRIALLEDGGFMTVSYDGSIRRWDSEGNEVYKIKGQGRELMTFTVLESYDAVVAGGLSPELKIFSLSEGKPVNQISNMGPGTLAVFPWENDGAKVVSVDFQGHVRIWNPSDWSEQVVARMERPRPSGVALHAESGTIGISADYGARLLSLHSGERVGDVIIKPKGVHTLAISHKREWIVLGAADGMIRGWRLDD